MKTRDQMCLNKKRGCFCAEPGRNHIGGHVCICGERWPRVNPNHPAVRGKK